ncbi:uncharacterized protein [Solanum lycopersicum]|uniref:uncharacterized protein n=1 Tax=Solanum lycopersicum TaxID=4081 RepID=UPI00374A705E
MDSLDTNFLRDIMEQVLMIQYRLLTAQSRQNSYENQRDRALVFMEGDHVCLRVSPMKGVMRIRKKDLTFEEERIAILDRQVRKFRTKEIASVKVQWKHQSVGENTLVSMYDSRQVIEDVTIPVLYNIELDLFQNSLSTVVTDALELFSFLNYNKSILRQSVMKYLRDFGYNAAICKTKWGSSGGVTSGNYEFIDVIRSDSSNQMINHYIIDLDFAAEFEIARPTNYYKRMLQSLRKAKVKK